MPCGSKIASIGQAVRGEEATPTAARHHYDVVMQAQTHLVA